jgi:hypothetical protein
MPTDEPNVSIGPLIAGFYNYLSHCTYAIQGSKFLLFDLANNPKERLIKLNLHDFSLFWKEGYNCREGLFYLKVVSPNIFLVSLSSISRIQYGQTTQSFERFKPIYGLAMTNSFSLLLQNHTSIDLIAPDSLTFELWWKGLHFLMKPFPPPLHYPVGGIFPRLSKKRISPSLLPLDATQSPLFS